MLSIIGAGLSRTGTYSLHLGLEMLGFKGIHFDRGRLDDVISGANPDPDFRRFDDVDMVGDLPYAFYYHELFEAYPDSKVILTVRNTDDWWRSVSTLFNVVAPVPEHPSMREQIERRLGRVSEKAKFDDYRRRLRIQAYGSTVATEFLYKKRFEEHNRLVIATIPPECLLIMDVTAGEGWEKLCPFLRLDVPDKTFPHAHKTNYSNPRQTGAAQAG